MCKLLSAGFVRLWRDKVFWLCMLGMLVMNLFIVLNGSRQASGAMAEYGYTLDRYYYNEAPLVGMFTAIIVSLFVGTEYYEGAVRNKLAVGHTRSNIYLANFVVCYVAGICIVAVWLLSGFAGIPFLGGLEGGVVSVLKALTIAGGYTAAFTAIFTLVSNFANNRATLAVLTILVYIALLMAASKIYSRLDEPQMIALTQITAEGVLQTSVPEMNPLYVDGAKRAVFEFLLDFLPTGQGILLSDAAITHPVRQILSSIGITLVTLWGGTQLFKKKDLK
ncbi:MAG: ABC transporter permease subunit [Lachnospiraceae bacterium]|nr:ABC transporter permease subunit [Lachnospiraceae bacterium]